MGRLCRTGPGEADPWGIERIQTTAFRVRHTEFATSTMEELYFTA